MALELLSLSHATPAKITGVSFSPCGRYIVSIDDAKQMYVWKWEQHKLIFAETSEKGKFNDVCFLPDMPSMHFLTAAGDGAVSVWHLDTGASTCRLVQKMENKSGALSLAVTTCGRFAASGHHGHYVQIWKRSAGAEKGGLSFEAGVMLKHSDSARQVCVSKPTKVANPDGSGGSWDVYYVAACSDKGHIKIWGLHQKTGELIQSVALLTHRATAIASICFSYDVQQLLYSVSGFVVLLNLSFNNKKPGVLQMDASPGPLRPILGNRKCDLVSADDEQPLCVCANDTGLFLWDRENTNIIPVASCLAWGLALHCPPAPPRPHQDPRLLCALALAAGEVALWDLTDWEVPAGLDTNKRKRMPRSHETKEDQEKEYEDRRIRKMQADQADVLERLKRKEEDKTKKHRPERIDDSEVDEGDDSTSSSADSSSSSSSDEEDSSEEGDSEGEDQDGPAAKQRKSVPVVLQDKVGAVSEPKWVAYFEAAVAQGGLVPVDVPSLTSKGFCNTEIQQAIVF